jgi:hypothetical protein
VIGAYVRLDADEALSWAESLDGPGGFTWNMVIRSIAFNQPEKALQIINDIQDPMDQRQALESALKTISNSQPQLAIQFAELLPEGALKSSTIEQAARRWGHSDALAVLEWLPTQPEAIQAQVLVDLAEPLAMKDLGFAMSYPVELVPQNAKKRWVSTILRYAAREDPQAAFEWVRQFKGHPEYGSWLRILAGTWAHSDPYAALDLVSSMPDGEDKNYALRSVLGSWASTDGSSASEWVVGYPSGRVREDLIQNVAFQWHRAHPSACKRWVTGLQNVNERDRGLLGMINAVMPDIAASEAYIDLLTIEQNRISGLTMLIDAVAARDTNEAQAYLDALSASEMPDELRIHVQESIDRVRQYQNR